MVDPMDPHDFHSFREIIADMIGDQTEHKNEMVNRVGREVSAEMADSIARLDQRPLMKG